MTSVQREEYQWLRALGTWLGLSQGKNQGPHFRLGDTWVSRGMGFELAAGEGQMVQILCFLF